MTGYTFRHHIIQYWSTLRNSDAINLFVSMFAVPIENMLLFSEYLNGMNVCFPYCVCFSSYFSKSIGNFDNRHRSTIWFAVKKKLIAFLLSCSCGFRFCDEVVYFVQIATSRLQSNDVRITGARSFNREKAKRKRVTLSQLLLFRFRFSTEFSLVSVSGRDRTGKDQIRKYAYLCRCKTC